MTDRSDKSDKPIELEWFLNHHAHLIDKNIKGLSAKGGIPEHVPHDDLWLAGAHGLIDAVHKFDPEKGPSFSQYAYGMVGHALKNHIQAATAQESGVSRYYQQKAREMERQTAKEKSGGAVQPSLPQNPEKKSVKE